MASFNDGSLSLDSVLLTSKLQPILLRKEVTELEEIIPADFEVSSKKKATSSGRRKRGETKSLFDLEFEELKGFMDLDFVFLEEDRNSSLASLIPELQRLGKKDGEEEPVDETATSRLYLSEAWVVLDRRNAENPLMNWKIPALIKEIDMKDSLRWWALWERDFRSGWRRRKKGLQRGVTTKRNQWLCGFVGVTLWLLGLDEEKRPIVGSAVFVAVFVR